MGIDVTSIVLVGVKLKVESYSYIELLDRYDEITGEKKKIQSTSTRWRVLYKDKIIKDQFDNSDIEKWVEEYNEKLGPEFKDAHVSFYDSTYDGIYLFGIKVSETDLDRCYGSSENIKEINETFCLAAAANSFRALFELFEFFDFQITTYHYLDISY